jgi:hypothetical protein
MDDIKVEYTKEGHPVPIVNGVYLHSIFDPINEAKKFVTSNEKKIKTSENILVLGLGFGYHIEEIINYAKDNNVTKNIFILEPSTKLVDKFKRLKDIKNITIINPKNMGELFEERLFIELLLKKPATLAHINSFNLNRIFFKQFLNWSANETPQSYLHLIKKDMKDSLANDARNFSELISEINRPGNEFTNNDFLLLGLNEIIGY